MAKQQGMVEEIYQLLGERIKHERLCASTTQRVMAGELGMTQAGLSRVESGTVRISLVDVKRYAEYFGMKPKDLMRGIW